MAPIRTIDDAYVDGLSITHGNPRKHLWTLAVGTYELSTHLEARCPLDLDAYNISRIPEFVGNNYYCEALEFGKTGLLGRILCGMDSSVSQVLHSLVQDMAGFIVRLHQVKKT